MRLSNFALRVALILGLSPSAFGNALADGRAVLPPKWMIEAYLSDAVVKPSRDDIARAIIPGLGMVPAFLGGGAAAAGYPWTARSAAEANTWYAVTYGNGLFVAVANNGTNRVMTSPDGVTWTARSAAQANLWSAVTYGNGLFVAVAYSGTNRVMTAP